jgi:predicted nucleic acid-binding protein
MAGLVFDASALIALVDSQDEHFKWAFGIMTIATGEPFYISAITYAEVLVHPARGQKLDIFIRDLADSGFEIVDVTEEDSFSIATVRAETNLKTPDATVIALAKSLDLPIATADLDLAAAARKLGIGVFQPNQ